MFKINAKKVKKSVDLKSNIWYIRCVAYLRATMY